MIEINLLPEELKAKNKKFTFAIEPKYFVYAVPIVFGVLICLHIYLAIIGIQKNYQLSLLNRKWKNFEPQRKMLESFRSEQEALSTDANIIQQLSNQRIDWSEKLNQLSLNLPSSVWFNELSFGRKDFVLKGSVISLQKEEMTLINKFMDNLKKDVSFFKDFNALELGSVQRRTVGGYEVVDFILVAKL